MQKFLTALVTSSLVVAALVAAPVSVKAAAVTYYVGPGTDTGGSCTTPDYTTDAVDDDEAIQDAVDAAVANAGVDTIVICDGSYVITAQIDATADTEGLIIEGETSAELSVLDGAGASQFLDTNEDLTIGDLTFSDFRVIGDNGAVIHNDTADDLLTVEDSVFSGSSANYGGAIYWGGQGEISDSTFEDNFAEDDGGALYFGEDASIGYSVFESNFAENHGGAVWGSIVLTLNHSDFVSNSSWGSGGAVSADNDVYTLHSTFTGNGTTSEGGAIYTDDDSSTGYSVFTDNTSGYRGGAIYNDNDEDSDSDVGVRETHVYHSVFTGNKVLNGDVGADGRGGAVFGEDECTVTDSTFTDNEVSVTDNAEGGALYCDEDIDLLADNRFSGNSATGAGYGAGGAVFGNSDLGWSSDSSSTSGAFRNSFTNNTASDEGGGMFLGDDIEAQFSKNVFKRNSAGLSGGGLYVDEELEPQASFTGNRFDGNIATDGDGGGAYFGGDLETGSVFKGNRFSRNRAGDLGGALRVELSESSDPLNLSRNTFVLNRARIGGAVGGGEAVSRGDARVLQRALRGNRLSKNKATQQRRTFNVGIEILEPR
jgi:predicted outer membrane repeat protein